MIMVRVYSKYCDVLSKPAVHRLTGSGIVALADNRVPRSGAATRMPSSCGKSGGS